MKNLNERLLKMYHIKGLLKRLTKRSKEASKKTVLENSELKLKETERKTDHVCDYQCIDCQRVGCCFSCKFCEGVRFFFGGTYVLVQFNLPRDLAIITCRFDIYNPNEIHDRFFRVGGPAFLSDKECPNWVLQPLIKNPNLAKTENGNFQSFWR